MEERAARVHKEAIIVDGHNDIPSVMFATGVDLAARRAPTELPRLHTDLARMKAGGITGEFFSIYVDHRYAEKPTVRGGGSARHALDLIDIVYQQVERHPDALMIATRAEDIRRAKREGKVACLMGVEGGHAIENSLFALRTFHRLGVRYMTLTHTNTNEWADSSGYGGVVVTRHHGLTPFGEKVVREMQRIGMLVDISHVSDETAAAVLKMAKAPVIASHSSARALAPHPRNLSDDLLRALARNGGVAMVNFFSAFLDPKFAEAEERFAQKYKKELAAIGPKYETKPLEAEREMIALREGAAFPVTPLSLLIDHIEHIIQVAGIDHVGLGSDFDGVTALPAGIDGVDSLPKITLELLRRGHSEEDVRKVLGGNFLRAFEAAEAYAKGTNTTLSGDGDTTSIDSVSADAGTR
ncbi:dipeptidase [Pendulispora albinea]|uniref:Dipeptidase n=1 Tax=Pendulispora albinea TaxID=2741071 RepID=A0ABZ2LPK1_9BACT